MDIRQAQRTDCTRLSALIAQLGYEVTPALLERKLAEYSATEQNCVLVGVEEGHIVGLIVLNVVVPFHEDGSWGRISALVVADGARERGVGRALLEEADAFFLSHGCQHVEVTSSAHRADAHRFYLSNGYHDTPKRFVKAYGH